MNDQSKTILVLSMCLIVTLGIAVSQALAATACDAVADLSANILHIPCLYIGSTSYAVDLSLVNNNPVTLQLQGYNANANLNLSGNWLYSGNLVARDGNIQYSYGTCQATQTNDIASFSCQTQYYLSLTGDQGSAQLNFNAAVSTTGIDVIAEDISCADSAGPCTCTLQGSGTSTNQALTVDFIIASKTCNSAFTVTSKALLTMR